MSGRSARSRAAERGSHEYEVGFGRPPAQHRFRKGVSGNPRGRPRSSTPTRSHNQLIEDAFLKAANEQIVVGLNGRRVRMTRMEAFAHQTATQAVKGDPRSGRLFLDTVRRIPGQQEGQLTHEDWLDLLNEPPQEPENITVRFVSADGTVRYSNSQAPKDELDPK